MSELMNEEMEMEEVAVLDDASAEMILQQLKKAEDQYERMKAWYDHQISNLKDIRDRTREWAETCLRPYFDMVPTTGKKIRSYEMPGGVLKLAKQDPKFTVKDEELVPWLEKNEPEYVKVKKEAAWGEWKKAHNFAVSAEGSIVTEDGEVVPGVTVTAQEDKFTIKIK